MSALLKIKITPARLSRGVDCCEVKLLQRLLNSNSHGNGHTDHGVVTCAQEASEAGLPVGKNPEKK